MDGCDGWIDGRETVHHGVYTANISIESLVLGLISYYIFTCEMEMQVVTVQRL